MKHHRRPARSCARVAPIMACVVSIPSVAWAEPPATAPSEQVNCVESSAPDSVEGTPEYVTASRLFDRGVVRYDSGDYESAITLWQEAAGVLPRTYDYRLIKAELVYNVAQALQRWFEVDHNLEHLRQARISLENFDREIPDVYQEPDRSAEREKVREKVQTLESMIAVEQQAQREAALALAEAGRANLNPELIAREHGRNRAMIGSGAALTVLGMGGLAMMGVGLSMANDAEAKLAKLPGLEDVDTREAQLARGEQADTLVLAGAVTGGVLLVAGVPVLITGAVFEHRLRGYEKDHRIGVVPAGGRGRLSLVVHGRF